MERKKKTLQMFFSFLFVGKMFSGKNFFFFLCFLSNGTCERNAHLKFTCLSAKQNR